MDQDRVLVFVQLLGNEERRLYAYILSLVPCWADADEIVQKTRIRLWQQFDEYDPSKDFGAWARTIAHYLILAHRKTRQREQVRLGSTFVDSIAQQWGGLDDLMESRSRFLADCLQKLTKSNQMLMRRYYGGLEERSMIARDIGQTSGGLRQKVRRLRLVLSKCIDGQVVAERSK